MDTKKFLLAGASSGIGREALTLLEADGHEVHLTGRSPEAPVTLKRGTYQQFAASGQMRELDLPEALDGAVWFPGTITLKPFLSLKDQDFQNDLEVNFLGAVRLIRAVLPSLKRSGNASIVLFSTVAAQTGLPYHASIASAKAAVEGLTRSLAAELSPGIRVNCIAPSLTDTPLASALLGSDEKTAAAKERHPLKRIGNAAETAKLVRFLLGEDSGFMTGQILGLDGGMSSVRTF